MKVQINQWNRLENQVVDQPKYSKLSFDKGAKTINWRKDILFNKCYWNDSTSHTNMNPDTFYKNQLKIHHRPKCEAQNYNTPRR